MLAKGGGKSYLIRAKELYNRLKYPQTRGLIVRKTLPELRANHITKFFEEYPETRAWYNKSEKVIYYPNGSMTEFSYLQSTDDVFTYQGREYENISVDEATQHEETVFKILRTSNRTSKPELRKQGFIPSMLLTGNPGGIGNAWVKRIFIERNFKDEEEPTDFDFVQAFVADNPALLSADPDYVKRLQGLPESLRRAYLDGDWNVLGGMAFAELNERTHLIDAFALPVGTKYFAGYDHGFNHPFAFVLFALTPDDKMYCVKYYKDRLLRPDEIAKGIIELTANCGRVDIYAGHDLWAKGRDGGPTIYEQFVEAGINSKNGLHIHRAKIDRKQGVSEIRKFVAWRNTSTNESKLKFFKNTRPVFDNIAGMQFDMKEPEDVLKIDADEDGQGGDDLYDSARYGLMSRNYPTVAELQYADNTAMKILQDHLREKQLQRESEY